MDSDEADLSVPTAVTSPSELGYADTVAFRRNDDPPAPVAPEEEVTRDDIHHAWATQAKEATPAVPTSSPNALNSAPTEQIPDGYARPGGLASTVSTENTTRHRKVGAEELFGAADPLANLPSEELTAELDAKTSIFRQDSAQFPRDTVPGPQDSGTQDTPQAKPAHRWTGESDISVELDMTPQSIPAVANPAVAVEGKTSQEIDGPPAPRASETTARRVVARGSRWVLLVVLALLVMAAAAAAGHFYKQHRQRESQRKTPADTRPMERSSATPSPRSAADASSR